MNGNKANQCTPVRESLESVQQRFGEWRATRSHLGPIPKDLWHRAVEQAQVHGVGPTAKALRLHAGTLKEQLQRCKETRSSPTPPVFIELASGARKACTVEFLGSEGTRMRIEFSGAWSDELRLLAETFLRSTR